MTRALLAIAAAGTAVRALYLFTIGRDVTGIGDWFFYHRGANLLADGMGFVDPFQVALGNPSPSAGHPPLYTLVLGGVSWLGGTTPLWHRSVGLLLGAVTIVLVGLLAQRVAGDRVGLVAAGIAALYPAFVAVDGALMSETLYSPLVAGMFLAALALVRAPRARTAALLGAVIGLAALTRSEALLFVPFLVFPLAVAAVPWRHAALAVAACILVIAPWTIRNAVQLDAFVPISTNDSTVLAGANCDLTYHGEDLGLWNLQCISPRRKRAEAEQAEIWREEGIDYAREHPGRLPVVAAVRLLRVWDLWQPRRQVLFAEGRHIRVQQAAIAAYFVLAAFAIAGGAALWRRRRVEVLVLLTAVVVVSVTAVTGYGVSRLRHAAEIPLVVLAAAGLVWAWERRAARRPAPPPRV